MPETELKHLYFEWMYRLVCDDRYQNDRMSYRKLLSLMNATPFDISAKDQNDDQRVFDGLNLRYRFAYSEHLDYRQVALELDLDPCSVLEAVIALAIRCEDIMADYAQGDRTSQWFWLMLQNLDLARMNDAVFDREEASYILECFNNNDFDPDGKGGLFYIPGIKVDMRDKEISWQMCHYLDELYI